MESAAVYTRAMLFRFLKVKKAIKEARQNPGGFAGGEVVDVLLGLLWIPIILALAVLVLFFLLGFTTVLGGPFGLFKVLFILAVIIALVLFSIIRPIIRLVRRGTKRAVDTAANVIRKRL